LEGLEIMKAPEGLRYSKEHEWAQLNDKLVKIGISHFAQSELGDIVFVELPEFGEKLKANEPFGSVESVKTVSELYAPLSGKVVAVNEELDENPDIVNASPYEKGWMIILEPEDEQQLEQLMSQEEYEDMIKEG
jgi:glycine cleavage system H protein